ncbi:hypothetical protein T4E_9893 [Trichinella pseudospiralis]|uniref:Uncharacterized protein n=1 Tax=Trichinella pseudospiralis TaxID=6337 RepID=A0A0V0XGM5_TRIPS|nr:hypothetical protein T4E_9893 [Trichinella pseudospiralis]
MSEPLPKKDQFHWARVLGMQQNRRKCLECRELTTVQKAVHQPLPSIFTVRYCSNNRQKDTGGPYSRGAVNTDWRESSPDSVRSHIIWFRVRGGCTCTRITRQQLDQCIFTDH